MSNVYILCDTLNGRVISRHRTIRAAVRADQAFANGRGSYIPTVIRRESERSATSGAYATAIPLTDLEREEYDRAFDAEVSR